MTVMVAPSDDDEAEHRPTTGHDRIAAAILPHGARMPPGSRDDQADGSG